MKKRKIWSYLQEPHPVHIRYFKISIGRSLFSWTYKILITIRSLITMTWMIENLHRLPLKSVFKNQQFEVTLLFWPFTLVELSSISRESDHRETAIIRSPQRDVELGSCQRADWATEEDPQSCSWLCSWVFVSLEKKNLRPCLSPCVLWIRFSSNIFAPFNFPSALSSAIQPWPGGPPVADDLVECSSISTLNLWSSVRVIAHFFGQL